MNKVQIKELERLIGELLCHNCNYVDCGLCTISDDTREGYNNMIAIIEERGDYDK